jgi:predicted amidohydrolase YtcJ
MTTRALLLTLLLPSSALCQARDVIYYNASVITMSPTHPTAQAVALRGDRFLAVGSNADVLKTAGLHTQKIDLGGKCIVPGIIETHVHPITSALSEIDGLVPVIHSIADLKDYIQTQDKKLPPDRLIFIPKVYSTRLTEHRYPTRYELDQAATATREVVADNGYAAVVNSVLLKRLGITRDTPQPQNGRIEKDAKGEPTGLILGAPQLLQSVRTARPTSANDRLWALKNMLARYNSVGITSIIDRSEGPEGFRAYQALYKSGEPKSSTFPSLQGGATTGCGWARSRPSLTAAS